MTTPGGAWELPGPARLLGALCDRLYRERALVLRAPTAPAALADAVERRLNDDGQVRVLTVALDPARPALAQVAAAAGARGGGAAALVTDPALRHCAIVVTGAIAADGGLADAVRLALHAGDAASPLIVIVGDGSLRAVGAAPVQDIRGAVGPLDSAARLASLLIGMAPFERRLVAAVVAEVATWDVDLLDRLASLPIADAVRPDRCVDRWRDDRLSAWAGRPADWAAGSLDEWSGEAGRHPLWLAANRPEALVKQVWRGQVAVLLPWIETRRLEIVAAFHQLLRPDPERSGPRVEALDWGPLRVQLGGQERWFLALVEEFRDARNELAHGRPLDWPRIGRCLIAGRRWAGGRGMPQLVRR